MFIQIDAFPEPAAVAAARHDPAWYEELTTPFQTVIGVRETGQAARTSFEYPLMAANLAKSIVLKKVEFRYRPSQRYGLEPPPLSWHLSGAEKGCIKEGWNEKNIQDSRAQVRQWLASVPNP